MREFQKYRETALKKLDISEFILNRTYPVVKDTRLLLGVIENIIESVKNTICSIVHYERLYHRVPPFHDNFESKYNLFRIKIMSRYRINPQELEFFERMTDIMAKHKKSPIEFSRKDKFVICSEGWRVDSVGIKEIREFIEKTKGFFNRINTITSKHESLFGK